MDDAPEIAVLQLPKFKAEATELIGPDGIEAVAIYLIDHPDAGDVNTGRWRSAEVEMGCKGQGDARRRTDHGEKKTLRQVVARLKRLQ